MAAEAEDAAKEAVETLNANDPDRHLLWISEDGRYMTAEDVRSLSCGATPDEITEPVMQAVQMMWGAWVDPSGKLPPSPVPLEYHLPQITGRLYRKHFVEQPLEPCGGRLFEPETGRLLVHWRDRR